MPDGGSFPAKEFRRQIAALGEALRDGLLCPVVGAGLSKSAGLPSWDELARSMAEELDTAEPELASGLDPLTIADQYEDRYGKHKLRTFLARELTRVNDPSPAHYALAAVSAQCGIFTTNYDPLLEMSLEHQLGKRPTVRFLDRDYPYSPASGESLIYKLCGDIGSPTSMVITSKEFREYPQTHPNLLGGLKEALKTKMVLVIGASLRDPNWQSVHSQVLAELGEDARTHYALFDTLDEKLVEEYRRLHLEPVCLGEYRHLVAFLREVQAAGTNATSADRAGPSTVFVLPPSLIVLDESLRQAYEDAKRKSDRGLWSSALADLELLLQRLESLPDERNRELGVSAHLLAGQLSLLSGDTPDTNRAVRHVSSARKLATSKRQQEIDVALALLKLHEGDSAGAQQLLSASHSDPAHRLLFALHLSREDLRGCDEALSLTQRTAGDLGLDRIWRPLIARYLALRGDFAGSDALVSVMLEEDASGSALEAAALSALLRAEFAVREFANAHAISEHLMLEIDLSDLVDMGARKRAVDFFRRAAAFYRQAIEPYREASALAASIQLRLPLQEMRSPTSFSADIIEDADRLRTLRQDHIALEILAALDGATPSVWIAGLSTDPAERLRTQIDRSANPPLICQWLRYLCPALSEPEAESVAEVFNAAAGLYDTPELQCVWASTMVDLYLRAGKLINADRILAELVVPMRYHYLVSALRLLLLRYEDRLPKAADLLRSLLAQFPSNPVVLSICARRSDGLMPLPMRVQCGRALVRALPTRFAYETLAVLLSAANDCVGLLETIEDADARGVLLHPRLAVLVRARCLLSSGRIQAAYPLLLKAYESGLCEPPDVHNLAMIEATERNSVDVAVELEREAIGAVPNFADPYIRLPQLLMRRGHDEDLREAYAVAESGAKQFPEDSSVLVNYLIVGYRTGHDEDVASLVTTLHERFPAVMLRMPAEQGIEMVEDLRSRAAEVERVYRTGPLPVLMFCALGVVRTSYYRFWRVSTLARSGLETAMGTQAGIAESLAERRVLPAPVVIDYTALVTLHELFSDKLAGMLSKAFTSIHAPESLKALLFREGLLLSEAGQPARVAATREVSRWVELSDRVTVVPPLEGEADPTGGRAIRAYAARESVKLLDEYPRDEDDGGSIVRIGLSDIVEALGATTAPMSVQQQLSALARPGEGGERPALEPGMSIAADILTLVTLAQAGALRFVAEYFGGIAVAKRAVQWLAGELNGDEFEEKCRQKFRSLERTVESLEQSGLLTFHAVQRKEDVCDTEDAAEKGDDAVSGAHGYILDTLSLGADLACPLVTDDRALLVITGDGLPPHRFGTDVLLRWLLITGEVDAAAYVGYYDLFRQWNYRALPPDPDYVAQLVSTDPSGESAVLADALEWYRQTIHLLTPERPLHPAYRRQLLRGALPGFMDSLWLTLAALWRGGARPSAASCILKHLALDRAAPAFEGRGPEFVQLLFSRATGALLSRSGGETGPRIDPNWLDQVLLSVPYDAEDLDLALVDEVREWLNHTLAQAPTKHIAASLIAEVLETLPARTREILTQSDVAPRLAPETGVRIETQYGIVLRTQEGSSEVRVSQSALEEMCWLAARRLLVDSFDTYEDQDLVFTVGAVPAEVYLVSIEVTSSEAHRLSATGSPLRRVLNLLRWFDSPDVDERRKAWEIGRNCLTVLARDHKDAAAALVSFEPLAGSITSEETGQREKASQDCQSLLRGCCGFVAKMMNDALALGLPQALPGIIHWTQPTDGASWLGLSLENLEDERSFVNFSTATRAELLTCMARSASVPSAVADLRTRWYSLFPDAAEIHQPIADAVLAMDGHERTVLIPAILAMAEESSSQAVKANAACLAVILLGCALDDAERGHHVPSLLPAERIRELLADAVSASGTSSDGGSAEPSPRISLAGSLNRAFYAAWVGSGVTVPALRYLSYRVGQLFADRMTDVEASATNGLAAELERYAGERLSVHLEDALPEPGFYRPELIPYLNYPGAFIGKQLSERRDSLAACLDAETRGMLLGAGVVHMLWLASAGGADALDTTWMDSSFSLDTSGGLAYLLAEAPETMKGWAPDQQAFHEAMNCFSTEDHWTWLLSAFAGAEADLEAARYLRAFELGAIAPNEDWVRRVARLTGMEATERAMRSLPLWEQFLGILSAPLIRWREPSEVTAVLEEFLFRAAGTKAEHQELLPSQAAWLAGLCSRGLYLERLAQWLEATALDGTLSLTTRRRCLRRFTSVWEAFPDAVQQVLRATLSLIAAHPGMSGLIELKAFASRPRHDTADHEQ